MYLETDLISLTKPRRVQYALSPSRAFQLLLSSSSTSPHLYIFGSAGRGPYAVGKESGTFHTHQPWLLDLKRHGRGPSASSVDHSSLPSFGHHRGHRARGAQFTPPKGKISVATSCCHLWLFVQKPNIASSSLPQHQSPPWPDHTKI